MDTVRGRSKRTRVEKEDTVKSNRHHRLSTPNTTFLPESATWTIVQGRTMVDIAAAEERIRPYIRETPVVHHPTLSDKLKADVYLKLESEQVTGAFKIRGCLNFMLKRLQSGKGELDHGFVAASSGCHALAVSKASQLLNVANGKIFIASYINPCKEAILRQDDVTVEIITVADVDAAEKQARQLSNETGVPYIAPYNDVDVVSGQGTIGLEIQRQLSDVDVVFCPAGGGGLIGGVATAIKAFNSNIVVVGCEVESSLALSTVATTGKFIDVGELPGPTLATALYGSVEVGSVTAEICSKTVDEWVAVNETEIARAIHDVYVTLGKRIEGGSAAAVAGYVQNSARFQGKKVLCVISGCHLDDKDLEYVLTKYGTSSSY